MKENSIKEGEITSIQLFSLIVLYLLGTTTVFARALELKQDAWLAILLGMIYGIVLVLVFTELQKHYPQKNYAQISIDILGKWIGIPFVILLILHMNMMLLYYFHEMGQLIVLTFLPSTPIRFVRFVFLLVSFYILSKGVQVLGRIGEMYFVLTVLTMISIFVLITISGQVDLRGIQPLFTHGVKEILKSTVTLVSFPFGEVFIFMMYYKFVDKKENIRKASILGIVVTGFLLASSTMLIIIVLGPVYASKSLSPLIKVIKLINIGDIITNVDAIGVTIIFVGILFKLIITLYAVTMVIMLLLKIKTKYLLLVLFTVGLFDMFFVEHWFDNYPFHFAFVVETMHLRIQFLFQGIIPVLLLLIFWLKNLSKKSRQVKKNS